MNNNKPSTINLTIRILLVFIFLVNGGSALYWSLLAVFIGNHIAGATLATVGFSIALWGVMKAAVQIPIARWLDHRQGESSDFYVILIGVLGAVVYSFAFLFITQVVQLYALMILIGIVDAFIMGAYYAIFSHHIDKNSQGFEWSLFSVGGVTISTAIWGCVGGWAAQQYGFSALFITAGILNIIATLLLILLYPQMKILRKPSHHKSVIVE